MIPVLLAAAVLAAAPVNPHQGRAVVECRVRADGRLTACVVRSETPPDAGVGRFALQLARGYRIAPGDRRVRDGRIVIPMQFKLPSRD